MSIRNIILGSIILGIAVFAGYKINQGLTLNTTPSNAVMAQGEDFVMAELDFTGKVHPALEVQKNDRVEGNPNATVTLIEYASMTCPHCAHFNNDVVSKIRKDYIETGKVKFIMRDLAWDNMAKAVAMVTRCAPKENYSMLVNAFFSTQKTWVKATDPLSEIKKVARMAGMDNQTVDACIRDPKLNAEVETMKSIARTVLNVRGTPTLFINGERLDGVHKYKQIKKYIDTALEQTKAKVAGGIHS